MHRLAGVETFQLGLVLQVEGQTLSNGSGIRQDGERSVQPKGVGNRGCIGGKEEREH
jgi:hypothetical protein